MMERLIDWCTTNRYLVAAAACVVTLWGAWAMANTPLDAVPDLSDVQVIVSTEWSGRSPDVIEDQVTYPIVAALRSAPRVQSVRGVTEFGVSSVYVIFEDRTDIYWARSRVVEYLQSLRGQLPEGVNPSVGPDATGAGWVFEYALVDETGRHSLADLRGFQDWYVRPWLASVPGVAEVASIGGFVKQYQITVNPNTLAAYDLDVKDVVRAVKASNADVEGRLLEFSGREYIVRGRGYLTSIRDIEEIAIRSEPGGVPVRVRDVATVKVGPDLRRGLAELDGKGEVVGGIIVMRFGENALKVIEAVKSRLVEVQGSLPTGVTILPTYDRSPLINESISTLRRTVIEEAIVVSLVVAAFLLHAGTALVPVIVLPIALVAAFIPMYYLGVQSNIMSLGGLALAIGVIVDASIVMVENAHRRASDPSVEAGGRPRAVVDAAKQVARPIAFSLAIIVISFAPVFLFEAQEGRLFRPLAFSKTSAVMSASLLALTLAPVLMIWCIRGNRLRPEAENPLSVAFARLYAPILHAALKRPRTALALNVAVILLTIPVMATIGHEFMPPLDEGTVLFMPTAPAGLSIGQTARLVQVQDGILRTFPEVETVFGSAGRGTTPTDNSPMGMVNTVITLKPRSAWRPGMTPERLQAEMDAQLQVPGVPNIWTQPIRSRMDMLLTGVRTPLGLKVLGSDVNEVERIGREVESLLQGLPGTRAVYAERAAQAFYTDVRVRRDAIARHGLTIEDVEDVVASAIGGQTVTSTIERRERYPVNVRYELGFRQTIPDLERVLVRAPSAAHVPLAELADISLTPGPAMIRDENGQLAAYVYVDAATRDIGGYVARARELLARHIVLPPGYFLTWTGQYEFQQRAGDRLSIVIPLVLASIFGLLCLLFRSGWEAALVMLSVAFAMTGGVLLQWILGYQFSVAVWVGYIALYGVAVQTGVVMVVYLQEALDRRMRLSGAMTPQDVYDATVAGAVLRLRPKLMTATIVMAGLLPMLWSSGAGSDLLKPMAAPIVGGMVTSTIHVLIVTPLIFYVVKSRRWRGSRP